MWEVVEEMVEEMEEEEVGRTEVEWLPLTPVCLLCWR